MGLITIHRETNVWSFVFQLDREGNICSDDKLPSQGCLVGEYNNLLLQLYQLLFDLKELMELCGQADKIQSEVFLKKAMKKACWDSDDAVADIVFQALKVDGFILRLLRYLKSQFNFCRTQAWKIRNEILRIGGTPINDPLSKDSPWTFCFWALEPPPIWDVVLESLRHMLLITTYFALWLVVVVIVLC